MILALAERGRRRATCPGGLVEVLGPHELTIVVMSGTTFEHLGLTVARTSIR